MNGSTMNLSEIGARNATGGKSNFGVSNSLNFEEMINTQLGYLNLSALSVEDLTALINIIDSCM
jgi:hypothetical protein